MQSVWTLLCQCVLCACQLWFISMCREACCWVYYTHKRFSSLSPYGSDCISPPGLYLHVCWEGSDIERLPMNACQRYGHESWFKAVQIFFSADLCRCVDKNDRDIEWWNTHVMTVRLYVCVCVCVLGALMVHDGYNVSLDHKRFVS